ASPLPPQAARSRDSERPRRRRSSRQVQDFCTRAPLPRVNRFLPFTNRTIASLPRRSTPPPGLCGFIPPGARRRVNEFGGHVKKLFVRLCVLAGALSIGFGAATQAEPEAAPSKVARLAQFDAIDAYRS